MTVPGAPRYCVATVTSDSFALGTLVMLDSFRRTNPWFKGDVVLIGWEVSPETRQLLEAFEPQAQWVSPGADLSAKLNTLTIARPELKSRQTRFLSLEAFGLTGYDRVLFCDSDLLFAGDFIPLFERPEALIACPDSATLNNLGRDAATFAQSDSGAALASFNAGMMLIDPSALGASARLTLLAGLDPGCWEGVAADHTDQFVLNRIFASRATIVAPSYNFLLGKRTLGFAHSGVRVAEARLLHFNGPAKPWDTGAMTRAAMRDAALLYAWRRWQEALTGLVERSHLKRAGWTP